MSSSATPNDTKPVLAPAMRTYQVGDPDPTPTYSNRSDYCYMGVGEPLAPDALDRDWYCTWPAGEPHDQHVAGCAGEVVAVRDDAGISDDERRHHAGRRDIQRAMDTGTYDPGPIAPAAPAPVATVDIDPARFRQLVAWKAERKECTRRSKELGVLIDEAEAALVEQFVNAGTDEIRIDGTKGTLKSTIWARKRAEEVTQAEVAAALRADGLAHMVTPEGYNSNTLSAWLRDLEQEGRPIPPHVAELIEPTEVWSIGLTNSRPTRARARMTGAGSSVLDGADPGASAS